jgi:subtilisin
MSPRRSRGPMGLLLAALLVTPALTVAPISRADALVAAPAPTSAPSSLSTPVAEPGDVVLPRGHAEIAARIAERGTARVLVGLRTTFVPEGHLGDDAAQSQRERIIRFADGLERELAGSDAGELTRLVTLAAVLVEVGPAGLERLIRSPRVASIEPDAELELLLEESVGLVGADLLHESDVDGAGYAVAVLDTGVDTTHPFFAGRIVAEACFSSAEEGSETLCPGGEPVEVGPGSAINCDVSTAMCFHGTHVAGIAVAADARFGGVAPGADLIPVQVFHRTTCSGNPCLRASLSDIVAALDHVGVLVDQLAGTTQIAAVNLSLGGGLYAGACDALFPSIRNAVASLASKGVTVIAASGNEGAVGALAMPACLSGTVAVGSTTKLDTVSSFSNAHPTLVQLLAPGSSITSAYPGSRIARASGTSAAAPHVAGAWALMRSIRPDDTPAEILAALVAEGVAITDTRSGAGWTTPRLSLAAFVPEPALEPQQPEEPESPEVPEEPVEPEEPAEPAEPDAPASTGLLRVTTSPAVVSAILVDGIHRADWGLDWLSLPVGNYEVCFGDVPGFRTPACRTVEVQAGLTTAVEGRFERLGLLKVDVAPGGLPATVHVGGEWRDEYGLFTYIDPGVHEVCWGDVPGYAAPACVEATVVEGGTTTIVGTYGPTLSPVLGPAPVPETHGFLRATTSPAVVSRISVDGVVRGDWGLNWVKVPAGIYEVCYSGVPGFTTPPCRIVEVVPGVTATTQGVFEPLGLLRVDVEPSVAIDVVIDGVPRNQFGLFSFFAPGSHQVCGTPAPDGRTAPCVQAVVVGGEQTRVVLEYR